MGDAARQVVLSVRVRAGAAEVFRDKAKERGMSEADAMRAALARWVGQTEVKR